MLSKKYMESSNKLIRNSPLRNMTDIYGNLFTEEELEVLRSTPHPSDGEKLGVKIQREIDNGVENDFTVCLTHDLLPVVRQYFNSVYDSRKHGNHKFCINIVKEEKKNNRSFLS